MQPGSDAQTPMILRMLLIPLFSLPKIPTPLFKLTYQLIIQLTTVTENPFAEDEQMYVRN